MTGDSRRSLGGRAATLVAVVLIVAGGAGTYTLLRRGAFAGAGAPQNSKTPITPAAGASGSATTTAQSAKVVVNDQGFEPASVSVHVGQRARLTFVRTSTRTCATEVLFPSLKIQRELPLNQPVVIEFTPEKTGELVFECGMRMLRGTVVVQPPG